MNEERRRHLYESLAIKLPEESILPVDSPDELHVGFPNLDAGESMNPFLASRRAQAAKWDVPAIWFLQLFGMHTTFERDAPQELITKAFYYMRDVIGTDVRILIEEPQARESVRMRLDPEVFEYVSEIAERGGGDSSLFKHLYKSGKFPF